MSVAPIRVHIWRCPRRIFPCIGASWLTAGEERMDSAVLETQDESLPRCLEPAVQVQSRLRLAAKSRSLGLIAAGRPLSQ